MPMVMKLATANAPNNTNYAQLFSECSPTQISDVVLSNATSFTIAIRRASTPTNIIYMGTQTLTFPRCIPAEIEFKAYAEGTAVTSTSTTTLIAFASAPCERY